MLDKKCAHIPDSFQTTLSEFVDQLFLHAFIKTLWVCSDEGLNWPSIQAQWGVQKKKVT